MTSLWEASDAELVATINIARMSQATISSAQDKEDWRAIAGQCLDELTIRGAEIRTGLNNLVELKENQNG